MRNFSFSLVEGNYGGQVLLESAEHLEAGMYVGVGGQANLEGFGNLLVWSLSEIFN
jgi:hypothetical protein